MNQNEIGHGDYTEGGLKEHDFDEEDPICQITGWVSPWTAGAVLIPVVLSLLVFLCVVSIPAGHVGIVDIFGDVQNETLAPGLNVVNPFAKVIKCSVRTQLIELAEDVPTKEGLTVHIEIAALIRLQGEHAPMLYRTVGVDYPHKVVLPQLRSIIREVTSAHEAKALYTATARTQMSLTLRTGLAALVIDRGIVVEETPLKKLELPMALQHSIEDKLQAEQSSQKMQFVIMKERQEATRKGIEAEGINNFQRIVSGEISEGMLRWKGIEATQTIAASSNHKVVIIGSLPAGGLPIFVNNDKQ